MCEESVAPVWDGTGKTPAEMLEEDLCAHDGDERATFETVCQTYRYAFGQTFSMGFGFPTTYRGCIDAMARCIREGKPYDVYEECDAPGDAWF